MTRKFCAVFVASLALGCTQLEGRTDEPKAPATRRAPFDWPGSMMNRWPVTGSLDRPLEESPVGRVVEPPSGSVDAAPSEVEGRS